MIKKYGLALGAVFVSMLMVLLATASAALADGVPVPGGLGFQPAASTTMERINDFHNMLLWIIGAIVLFVLALMIYICVRFRAGANPTPSKTTHNVPIEIIWTIIPVIILIVISVPSMQLLYYSDRVAEPEMTIKVTGYQWYWGFEYPDHDDLSFFSYMVPDDEINEAAGQHRLLSTDQPVYLPVDTDIQILVTAADVLHAFAVPAFGIKIDTVPGRLNETWVRITRPGTYYGQCSELCGIGHAFMPVEIRAVSKEEFEEWVERMKEEYAALDMDKTIKLAKAEGLE